MKKLAQNSAVCANSKLRVLQCTFAKSIEMHEYNKKITNNHHEKTYVFCCSLDRQVDKTCAFNYTPSQMYSSAQIY